MEAKEIGLLVFIVFVFGACGIGVIVARRDIWPLGMAFVILAVAIAAMGVHSAFGDRSTDKLRSTSS